MLKDLPLCIFSGPVTHYSHAIYTFQLFVLAAYASRKIELGSTPPNAPAEIPGLLPSLGSLQGRFLRGKELSWHVSSWGTHYT